MNRSALLIAVLVSTLLLSGVAPAQYPMAAQPPAAAPPSAISARPINTSAFASLPNSPPLMGTSPYAVPAIPAQYTPPPTAAPITPIPSAPGGYPAAAAQYSAPLVSPSPYTPPSTFAPPVSAPAPLSSPYTPPPAAVGAPPAFDPYATGSALGPPPPAVPYSYAPPPQLPATAYPVPPPSSTVPQTAPLNPYGAQPGVPTVASDEGYYAKAQRFLQELSYEQTFIYGKPGSLSELEINRTELASTFAVPMGYNLEAPLLVTPGFAFNWLEGPIRNDAIAVPGTPSTDLPPRIYDAYLDFAWYPHVTPYFGAELGFRTGVWSDFDHVTTESIRFLGRGLASMSVSPTLDILFGVVYLDRLQVKILPAGGVYWRPTPDWDAYIVFPNPKIRRYWMTTGNTKWYYYAAGEYGGGSWTVNRDGEGDRIDINDIRVIGGIEWETQTQLRGHIEAGYVFDRQVVYNDNMTAPFDAANTFMFRGGIEF